MIIINLIITFFRIILEFLILLFKHDYVFLLIIKIIISLLITSIIYYLYYYYKKNYKFSRKYAMKSYKTISFTLITLILYYSIFLLGFLCIRFYNTNKKLNLDVITINLLNIIKQNTFFNLFITFYFFVSIIILLKYLYHILMQNIKFHKHRLYYFTFLRQDFFEKIFWFITFNLTIKNLIRLLINQNIAYILYFFNVIRLEEKFIKLDKMGFRFRYELLDKLPRFALLFTQFFIYKAFVLHYYLLCLVFMYDMFFNSYTLQYIYKIMPYIFIYELIVRMSKSILVKNREYDTFLAYYLYATCSEKNEYIITLGGRTWTQENAYDIIADYAFNNFVDKNFEDFYLKPDKYDPFDIYDTTYFEVSNKIYKHIKNTKIVIIVFFIALVLFS